MLYVYDNEEKIFIKAEIVPAKNLKLPLKKDGWNFDWNKVNKEKNSDVYILRTLKKPYSIEGMLLLKNEDGMLIMDLVEIAPHNIGTNNKRFDNVTGCLIAFACRESFKIESDYKGFLIFTSKSNLIELYQNKYGAVLSLGRKMYIDDRSGLNLIKKYLDLKP